MELFVYSCMRVSSVHEPPTILVTGRRSEVLETKRAWHLFDAWECTCSNPDDKAKIMAVLERSDGGVQRFNLAVKQLTWKLLRDSEVICPHYLMSAHGCACRQSTSGTDALMSMAA